MFSVKGFWWPHENKTIEIGCVISSLVFQATIADLMLQLIYRLLLSS